MHTTRLLQQTFVVLLDIFNKVSENMASWSTELRAGTWSRVSLWMLTLLVAIHSHPLYALSPVPNIFELSLETVDGETLPLKNYRNKVLVVVNTASKCGFTPQYKDLESLHQRYKDRDVVVLGFPSNDFRNQEPGTDEEIKKFCKLKFGVTFPILRKGPVTGPEMQSFYRILLSSASPEFKEPPAWNFEKIIIGRNGQIAARFGSFVNPLSDRITSVIEREIEPTIDKKNP